jgi:hypothetical protein
VRTLQLCWTSNQALERDDQYAFFANLLHLPLSLAVGSSTIDLLILYLREESLGHCRQDHLLDFKGKKNG